MPPPPSPTDADLDAGVATTPATLEATVESVTTWIADRVERRGASGAVVVLRGRLRSAVVATLAVQALGTDRVLGLVLPAFMSGEVDAITAALFAEGAGIEHASLQVLPFVHLFDELALPPGAGPVDTRATTRAVDRLRAACAAYAADATDRLVLDATDRTEALVGPGATAGVEAGDLRPVGHLLRGEVESLAAHLGLPAAVFEGYAAGPDAADPALDVDSGTLDAALVRLVDRDLGIDATAAELGVDPAWVRALARRIVERRSRCPPVASLDGRRRAPCGPFYELELRLDDGRDAAR